MGSAIEMSQATNNAAKTLFDTVSSLSQTITSYGIESNASWPFVDVPHYTLRANTLLGISKSTVLALCPFVSNEDRELWEAWSVENQEDWIPGDHDSSPAGRNESWISPYISDWDANEPDDPTREMYVPVWQTAPRSPNMVNKNLMTLSSQGRFLLEEIFPLLNKRRETIIGGLRFFDNEDKNDPETWPHAFVASPVFESFAVDANIVAVVVASLPWHQYLKQIVAGAEKVVVIGNNCNQTVTYLVDDQDVFYMGQGNLHDPSLFDHSMEIATSLSGLGDGVASGVYMVGHGGHDNQNHAEMSHSANSTTVDQDDQKDHNDPTSDTEMMHGSHRKEMGAVTNSMVGMDVMQMEQNCSYRMSFFPTRDYFATSKTKDPATYAIIVVTFFMFTFAAFLLYDYLVKRRNDMVVSTATRSNAIVSSLFPVEVRDRLMEDQRNRATGTRGKYSTGPNVPQSLGSSKAQQLLFTKPIADLFPEVTVMFADICGFTSWASVREPSQVFTLLEQIYSSFDAIAHRRKIFKVETIGDCYVAALGLPEPRKDHATVMARFAHSCRTEMTQTVKNLEVLLGPDTAELTMRFGLHSGPVTAGVLRGEKSRFQLFGDTVNTAARIENLGKPSMIHISKETANLLIAAGKIDWVKPRKGLTSAKGKGMIQTYWLTIPNGRSPKSKNHPSADPTTESELPDTEEQHRLDSYNKAERTERLIDWNVNVLQRLIKKIVAMRDIKKSKWSSKREDDLRTELRKEGSTVLDEVQEVIPLSATNAKEYKLDPESVEVDPVALVQLRDYVMHISKMYRDNPFHNFDHASHVTQSVTKLLARIVTCADDTIDFEELRYKQQDGSQLHDYTYGITSDPIIQFAGAFSALIHDVDHTGLPNAQLVKEKTRIAEIYRNKSVAEQNSVEMAWELLMEPCYKDLRACIYSNQEELERFRQLVVNSVMATDIVDKELGALRKKRWNKAFRLGDECEHSDESKVVEVNRKATIVIEHLIQASDVAHTMQHWHVYIKWNERLFHEMYKAYLEGRADKDPSEGWYQGEIGFFDFYIIPLAKKLKNCGVFGVASDEYLNYANVNRNEWEAKGEDILAGYLAKFKGENPSEK
jgi:class 3 adenylate cyclase